MPANKVLLIEDDAVFRGIVNKFLSDRGYQVIQAEDGETGLALYELELPDVILCDLKLPKISGLEVLQQLVSVSATTPVIVISASEQIADIREAVQLGASDYLIKPIEKLQVLEEAIENCLSDNDEADALQQQWELKDHIDVLFKDKQLQRLVVSEFSPADEKQVLNYGLSHFLMPELAQEMLLVQEVFPNNQVFMFVAQTQALPEQQVFSLLVLKSMLNTYLRQGYELHGNLLRTPASLLDVLNVELCHSRMQAAFDAVAIWLDGNTGRINWAQSGERLELNRASHPNLAIGIWSQSPYKEQQGLLGDEPLLVSNWGSSAILDPNYHPVPR